MSDDSDGTGVCRTAIPTTHTDVVIELLVPKATTSTGQDPPPVVEESALLHGVDEASVTDSIPNGSSAANINIAVETSHDFDEIKLHPDYLLPPKIEHPLEQSVVSVFVRSCLLRVVGLLVAIPVLLLILVACVVALPLRLLLYIGSRCRPFKAFFNEPFPFSPTHCDPWWPLGRGLDAAGHSTVHCVLTVQQPLIAADTRQQLYERAIGEPANCARPNFPRYSRLAPHRTCCPTVCTTGWPHSDTFSISEHIMPLEETPISKISSLKDLEVYLNNPPPLTGSKSPWFMNLIGNFGNSQEGTACSLAVLHVDSRLTDHLCIARLLTLWTESRLVFDTEPKLRPSRNVSLSAGVMPPYNVFLGMSCALWSACQLTTLGTFTLIRAACLKRHRVWADCRRRHSFTINRKRFRDSSTGSGAAIPSHKKYRKATSSTVNGGGGGEPRRSSSLCSSALLTASTASNGPATAIPPIPTTAGKTPTHRITWCRIPNMDQLLRAERILRAATVDMFLAFVAGALRRHFRSQGIKHPPDTRASMPVSRREFLPISSQQPCKFCLVPITLPTATEGAIPRIWGVQRNLTEAFDSTFPKAAQLARTMGEFFLPLNATRELMSVAHRSAGCLVNILRATGNVHIDNRRLHSMLMYTPMPETVPIGFTFVQCGTEMVASVALDPKVFPDADKLLGHLQSEIQGLLAQLSVRLLTLSQATFLPMQCPPQLPVPPIRSVPSPAGATLEVHQVNETISEREQQQKAAASGFMSTDTVAVVEPQIPVAAAAVAPAVMPSLRQSVSRSSQVSVGGAAGGAPSEGSMSYEWLSRELSYPEWRSDVSSPPTVSGTDQDPGGETSLEELEKLLVTVQNELETMKANPQGDRADYVAKLATLEEKMEAFHRSISRRLGPNFVLNENVHFGDDSSAVEALLAPYREEGGVAVSPSRRESRDSRRDSGAVIKLMRKRSKRTESPTRRISVSPKASIASSGAGVAGHDAPRMSTTAASSRSRLSTCSGNLEP